MFYVLAQSCKDCQTVQTLYKTIVYFLFLSYKFLSLVWSMKSNIYFISKNFPKLRFEWLYE